MVYFGDGGVGFEELDEWKRVLVALLHAPDNVLAVLFECVHVKREIGVLVLG